NILGIILGNLELLKDNITGDDKALKRVETISKSAQRAADLTKQLLGFSRRQPNEVTVTDTRRAILDMDNLIARSVTPEVEVEHDFAKDLWLTEIDSGDFQDALLNLIINARDAIPGGGRLTLETANKTLDAAYCVQNPGAIPGKYVQLAVSDSGKGIPYDQLGRIFEPFFTTKEQGKGTGLGLAMVYGFVKRSGGHIKVYSEQGIGTTFRLYLPRAKGEEQLVAATDEQPESLPHGRETILAVDDEEDLLELAQSSLEALGYRVLVATSGRQTLERLAEEPAIDLLFSDVVMPGRMNGYELAEQVTAIRPALKVLLTSGYTEKAVTHNGQARFTANLLSKPYTQPELAQRVRTMLDDLVPPHVV
ncbi:MAG: response regulator, partial [Gammaproteobacteria bacterium]|nr:response regulator [Gammaproteobacteria bacterium]